MAIDVHQCPRCELRFSNAAELRDHFGHDHAADPDTFDRYRYRARLDAPPAPVGPRHLVIGNQTLLDHHLETVLRERAQLPGASFYVLVPATHSAHVQAPPSSTPATSGDASVGDDAGLALARWRLRTAIDRFHGLGIDAEGQIGHPDPFTATSRLVAERRFDEIILSTLPRGLSRWLEVDLPTRLERRLRIPVTTVAADRLATT